MLKLFFVFFPLMMLAKSEIAVEWICPDTEQMGNCSTVPKITDLLQRISENNEYPDLYYCPFNIVERYSKCMQYFLYSCYAHSSDPDKTLLATYYLPFNEDSKKLCTKGRPYRKEFIEHAACTNAVLKAEHLWKQYWQQKTSELGELEKKNIDDMPTNEKCQLINNYWDSTNMHIRFQCGFKTEKFHRQVLGNMWPFSILLKLCNELSAYGV
ncbi:unnamed protein product [Aphis gossypii]|uniref:Secreted protein n=1 Tax=Aphis gossypii TaxID=80765 RepID=A0A9P0JCW7_APHGO|nr:unnamed protein product [Aphis gossypii]